MDIAEREKLFPYQDANLDLEGPNDSDFSFTLTSLGRKKGSGAQSSTHASYQKSLSPEKLCPMAFQNMRLISYASDARGKDEFWLAGDLHAYLAKNVYVEPTELNDGQPRSFSTIYVSIRSSENTLNTFDSTWRA